MVDLEHTAAIAFDEAMTAYQKFLDDINRDGFTTSEEQLPLVAMFVASLTTVYITNMIDNFGPVVARQLRNRLADHLNNSRNWLP